MSLGISICNFAKHLSWLCITFVIHLFSREWVALLSLLYTVQGFVIKMMAKTKLFSAKIIYYYLRQGMCEAQKDCPQVCLVHQDIPSAC